MQMNIVSSEQRGWGLVIKEESKVVNGQEGESSGFNLPALRSTSYQGATANFNKERLLFQVKHKRLGAPSEPGGCVRPRSRYDPPTHDPLISQRFG